MSAIYPMWKIKTKIKMNKRREKGKEDKGEGEKEEGKKEVEGEEKSAM